MKYLTTIQQQNTFKNQGYLELEALFSLEEVETLKRLLDVALASHLGISSKEIPFTSLENRFISGYELQRDHPPLNKAMKFSKLGQIVSGLFKEKCLFAAFTQYYPFLPSPSSLINIGSLTEIVGGVLIGFSPSTLDLCPKHPGNAVFFQSDILLPFPQWDFPLLLIAFASANARYFFQGNDPHTHFLKKLGYAFGDKLTQETHPLIFRS